MSRRLMLILAFALVVGLTLPAFAEVQNVKVSGDITLLGISRLNFDPDQNKPDAEESHGASLLRLRVDADLTENVSTTVRLLNERDWGQEADANAEIVTDLAFVTLKEFLYSPLTLVLGRQELHYGNDLIVGDPDTNNNSSGTSLTDRDLSLKKAFDAVRAILDYKPLVIDLIWAKIDEDTVLGGTTTNEKDDIDLFGVNARYDFGGNWKALSELYWFRKVDQTVEIDKKEIMDNIGLRAEINPTQKLILQGEVAIQFGKNNESNIIKNHQAMAAQGVARYAFNTKYDPVLMGIYSYFSGDVYASDDNSRGWDPMFENQTNGHISNVLLNQSNFHVFDLRGSLVPMDDLTLTLDFLWIAFAQNYANGNAINIFDPAHTISTANLPATGKNNFVGNELDVKLTYDYTEDVQMGLLAGWFIPGDAIDSGVTNVISEVIASCKVAF